jgi:protein-tyrosine phosphatase
MAEVLMRDAVAKRLGLPAERLEQSGILIISAGSAAMHGAPASREAVEAMRQRGLDLTQHAAQPVTERLARDADLIFAMTRGHRETLLERWPDLVDRVHLLSPDAQDVADPIGGPYELYQKCADQIANAIAQRVAGIDDSLLRVQRL